jgi:hypothetical protein
MILMAGTMNNRKLSKSKILSSNIEQLSKMIVAPSSIQLRMSGALLLGITIIFKRKLQYVLAEGNQLMTSVRLYVTCDAARNQFTDIDLPSVQKRNTKADPITVADIDLRQMVLETDLPFSIMDVNETPHGFRKYWQDVLAKGGYMNNHLDGTIDNMTETVSDRYNVAEPHEITLHEVQNEPPAFDLPLEEEDV